MSAIPYFYTGPSLRPSPEEVEEKRQARIAAAGLTPDQLDRLCGGMRWSEPNLKRRIVLTDRYLALLTSDHAGRLRSEFRKSLSTQVRAWINDPDSPHKSPLSKRQEAYI